MDSLKQVKLGIIACLEKMPTANESELQDIITGLVEDGYLPPSAPPSTTNWIMVRCILDFNRQLKRIKQSESSTSDG